LITFKLIEQDKIYSIIPLLQILDNRISEEILKQRLDEMVEQNYQCVGICDREKLIGICGIWIVTKYYVGKHIEPDNVVILPNYQNQNIGKKLMQWLYDFAKENDCIASELNCYVKNKEALKFWESEGYEIIGFHFQKNFKDD